MNFWIIAFIVWYAFSFGAGITRWYHGDGWIKVNLIDIFLGPLVTIFLLYMGGAFS